MAITIDQALIAPAVAIGTSATTVAITTNVAIAAGALIIVAAGCDPPTASVDSCADNGAGGTLAWTKDAGGKQSQTAAETTGIFSAPAPSGLASGTVITVTLNSASSSRWIGGFSVLGADTSASRIDGTVPAKHESAGSVTAWSSTSYTVAAGTIIAAATIFDINHPANATSPAVLDFTINEDVGGNEFLCAHQIVSAGGATVLAGAITVAGSQNMTIAAGYKVAAAAGASPQQTLIGVGA